jgi:gliding motility-associated-like protein
MTVASKMRPILLLLLIICCSTRSYSQSCTTLGQTPSTAFPVCGSTTFHQETVPLCSSNNLYVPGCSGVGGADYENRNPFFYKFTCYVAGTLGFLITPAAVDEDYDWQLYDITGHIPDDIFTVNSLVVTGNWAGTYGPTGASATGVAGIQCASVPTDNAPTFTQMPTLIAGHEYLLMISHFTNTQSGYDLSFGGGTGVITDPKIPAMQSVKPDCDGKSLTLKLNKKIRCNTLSANGSEFTISPAAASVISSVTYTCSSGFDFDSVTISLSAPLTNGNYQLVVNTGTDNNTLLDICGNSIPVNSTISFSYFKPQPIFADSIGKIRCAPDSLILYFPKKIACNSIAANGTDFQVTGPTPVTVASANGYCVNGKTDYVVIHLSAPIFTRGRYTLKLKAGDDGTIIIDECGQETPTQTIDFVTADTVSADFTYTSLLGCLKNTLNFVHDGAHDVTSWNWTFNSITHATTPQYTIVWPASSTNTAELNVSNGVCSDTVLKNIVLNNEVRAAFTMPPVICPEDKMEMTNTSSGLIDSWRWTYDPVLISTNKDPAPFYFPPNNNQQIYFTIKLLVRNNALNCTDSMSKTVTVLNNCYIAVPTAFTPNNDGLNDYFSPNNAIKADNLDFKVFNRWGQLVFHSTDWRSRWDGKLKGIQQQPDIFVWMLSFTHRDTGKQVFQKGTVMLIR